MPKTQTKKPSIKNTTSKTVYTTLGQADNVCWRLENLARCESASRRTVYRVVRLARGKYIVCATPWAYRLQQQGRGTVMSAAA